MYVQSEAAAAADCLPVDANENDAKRRRMGEGGLDPDADQEVAHLTRKTHL